MSLSAMRWAWDQHDVTPSEKLTLLALADQANGFYDCDWLGHKHFIGRTGFARRTLGRALRNLIAKKLIEFREDERGKFFHLCAPPATPSLEDEYVKVLGDEYATVAKCAKLADSAKANVAEEAKLADSATAHKNGTRAHAEKERVLSLISAPKENFLPVSNIVATEPENSSQTRNSVELEISQAKFQLDGGAPPAKVKAHAPKPESKWPEEDRWLREAIEQQRAFDSVHSSCLLDYEFWDDLSELTNGIDRQFVGTEFTRMRRWFDENPGRRPTPRGVRRFVRRWLERAAERGRLQVPLSRSNGHVGYAR